MTRCPCCGQITSVEPPIVDLDRNIISFRGRETRARPKVAEFVRVLSDHHPAAVTHSQVIAKVWGVGEPESSEQSVRLLAYQARRLMDGWRVAVHGSIARGYRFNIAD